MDSLLADLSFSLRSFRRTRGLTALAVLTIALGVGASTAVFSVLDAVVLRPLPYPEPHRVVQLWHDGVVTKAVMSRVMERVTSFEPVAGALPTRRTLTGGFEPEEIAGVEVTAGYWTLFGLRPAIGTLPLDAGTDPGQAPVVAISHRLWQRTFGGDPDIVGRTIRLGDADVTVTGVVVASHTPLRRATDFWMPLLVDPSDFSDYEGAAQVSLYGRLADGVDLDIAAADARVAAAVEHERAPAAYSEEWVARAEPVLLHDVLVQDARGALWTTMGAVLLVLLIACANVANLLLARAGGRQREIAVRLGLGAGRGRIVRQMLTESALLALAGGALGALLAAVITRRAGATWVGVLPRADAMQVDAGVLLFALATTALAALLFGLAPALRASAVAPRAQLADGGNTGVSARNRRLSGFLIGLEVALSVLLVIAAGLMLRTLGELVSVHPGFESNGVTAFRLRIPAPAETVDEASGDDAPAAAAPAESMEAPQAAYVRQVRETLAALPGIDAVGTATFLPMATGTPSAVYWVQDRERPPDRPPDNANFQLVSGDYFEAMGIPLRRGRLLEPADLTSQAEIIPALINETMMRTAFGNEDPVGQRITMFGGVDLDVIGVVADSRQRSLDQPSDPEVFLPFERIASFWPTTYFVLRSAGPPPGAGAIRNAVWQVNRTVPVLDLAAMDDVVADASGRTRLFARTLTGFGLIALLLAGVGVYGVTRHALGQQVREFGIRLALGATPGSIVRTALRRSLPAVLVGAIAGVAAAAAMSSVLQGLLYGVSPIDLPTYLAVPALLVGVGLVAAYLPARRAATVDPKASLNAG